jgi:Fe-S-cluster containining protein
MLEFDQDDELFTGTALLNEFFDCSYCGLCCVGFDELQVCPEEISEISKFLSIDECDCISRYTKVVKKDDGKKIHSLVTPCRFYKDKRCRIYSHRPLICKMFPLAINRDKDIAVLSGIYFCPQATQFYEGLFEFCHDKYPEFYDKLKSEEKNLIISSDGWMLSDSSSIISSYIDWLYPSEENQKS